MKCPNCNAKIKTIGIKFCEECGTYLKSQPNLRVVKIASETNKCPSCSVRIKNYELEICEQCGADLIKYTKVEVFGETIYMKSSEKELVKKPLKVNEQAFMTKKKWTDGGSHHF